LLREKGLCEGDVDGDASTEFRFRFEALQDIIKNRLQKSAKAAATETTFTSNLNQTLTK
jgi:hypothetical protein